MKTITIGRCPLDVSGVAAEYCIENGLGRRIDYEEALEILDGAEEAELVLAPINAREFVNVCWCCGCCCGMLRYLKPLESPADHVNSLYRAVIDPESCVACGVCLERCQIDAIDERGDFMEVDQARCTGCGLCVPTRSEGAVELVPREEAESPPANVVEMSKRIAVERFGG